MLTVVAVSVMVLASSALAEPVGPKGIAYQFEIEGVAAIPGKNYKPVTSTQPINLENSTLRVAQLGGGVCENQWLPTGQVYTLISTTAELSGTLVGTLEGVEVPDGGELEFPLEGHDCGRFPKEGEKREALQINYHETGPVQSVTATVVHGSPIPVSAVEVSGKPSAPVTNQPVTVTATIETSSGAPSGTVEFVRISSEFTEEPPGPACVDRPVIRRGSSFTARCRASFSTAEVGAGGSPFLHLVSAIFTPSPGESLLGSSGGTDLAVKPGPATAVVRGSNQRPRVNTKVTFTAIVTPSYIGPNRPNGSVEFLDGGQPIASCAAQQLVHDAFSSKAICETSYSAPGTHVITAVYTPKGGEFLGSMSQPRSVTVRPAKGH